MYQNKSRAVNGPYRKEHFMKKQPDGSNGLGEVVEQIHTHTDIDPLRNHIIDWNIQDDFFHSIKMHAKSC